MVEPGSEGAAWEGIFTVPMCDVGAAVDADYQLKEYILQPYGQIAGLAGAVLFVVGICRRRGMLLMWLIWVGFRFPSI